jgi:hypothetical protein
MARPLKALFVSGEPVALAEFTDTDPLAWGGGAAIASSDEVVTETELYSGGKIKTSLLPSLAITDTFVVASQAAMLALTAERGDVAIRTDNGNSYILSADDPTVLANWLQLTIAAPVTSVNGHTGAVVLNAADVGAVATTAVINEAHGGTNQNAYATGDILYASGVNTLARRAATTNGYVLTLVGGVPDWAAPTTALSSATDITLTADNDSNGSGAITMVIGATTRWTMTNAGIVLYGAAVATDASAGDVVAQNAHYLRGTSAAADHTYRLIGLNAANVVEIDSDARGVSMVGSALVGTFTSVGGNVIDTTTLLKVQNSVTTIATSTSQTGILVRVRTSSSATTQGAGVISRVDTDAVAYTLSAARTFYAQNPSVGAGSTITTAYAFYADNFTTGATNYAFFVPSGSAQCQFNSTRFNGTIAFTNSPQTNTVIFVNNTTVLSGATNQFGLNFSPLFGSDGTSTHTCILTKVTTTAAAYTTTSGIGLRINDASLGAGSAITTQYGILIDAQTQGGTNWAIQTAGVTRSAFVGGVNIGVTTTQTSLLYVSTATTSVNVGSFVQTGATATAAIVLVKYGATPGAGGNGLTIVKSDGTTNVLQVTDKYSMVLGNAALATNATDGFFYMSSSAGAPSGTPTAFSGRVPIHYDTTNDTLNIYNGSWKPLSFTGIVDNASTTSVYFNVDSDNNDGTNADNFVWGRDRTSSAGGTTLMQLNASGYLLLGTTITTSVAAFDIVIPRGNFLRGVNNAGTDTKPLIGIDTTDTVLLGSTNVRVQSGIFLVNTAVTTAASSGDIVQAFSRGLRILDNTSTTAYLAIDRTTVAGVQALRLNASVTDPLVIGSPGSLTGAGGGDLVLQNANGLYIANGAATAAVKVLGMNSTNDTTLNGTNSISLQTAATDRLKIDSAGNVLLWAGAGLGGGVFVLSIHNATTDPTSNPTAGGILYASGGALKWRGSSGTVTTIAPA